MSRDEAVEALAAVVAALTSEDEIAHGEAVKTDSHGGYIRLGGCAYDNEPWPCHTQRGIDRLLARIRPILDDEAMDPATPPESR